MRLRIGALISRCVGHADCRAIHQPHRPSHPAPRRGCVITYRSTGVPDQRGSHFHRQAFSGFAVGAVRVLLSFMPPGGAHISPANAAPAAWPSRIKVPAARVVAFPSLQPALIAKQRGEPHSAKPHPRPKAFLPALCHRSIRPSPGHMPVASRTAPTEEQHPSGRAPRSLGGRVLWSNFFKP